MKLCFHQRVFSWFNHYDVTSDTGVTLFSIQGEFALFHHRLRVYDAQGNEVATIEEQILTFLKRFFIDVPGKFSGELIKEWTFLTPRFRLSFLPWVVEGDFLGWDYRIFDETREIARMEKELLTWGDTYVLDVNRPEDTLLCLLIVVGIDIAKEDSRNH